MFVVESCKAVSCWLLAVSCSVLSCEVESANSEACANESVFILESNWLLAVCCWLLSTVVVSLNAVLKSCAVSTNPFPEAAETLFIKPLKVDAVSASWARVFVVESCNAVSCWLLAVCCSVLSCDAVSAS